jgi:hypothetical protein
MLPQDIMKTEAMQEALDSDEDDDGDEDNGGGTIMVVLVVLVLCWWCYAGAGDNGHKVDK